MSKHLIETAVRQLWIVQHVETNFIEDHRFCQNGVTTLTDKIVEALTYLSSDRVPRTIKDISETLGIPSEARKMIVSFLVKCGLIQSKGTKLILDPEIRDLLVAPRTEEPGIASLTAASPPEMEGKDRGTKSASRPKS